MFYAARCAGLPDGDCPMKRHDHTVKNGSGDLMLCPDCDRVRHELYIASLQVNINANTGIADSRLKTESTLLAAAGSTSTAAVTVAPYLLESYKPPPRICSTLKSTYIEPNVRRNSTAGLSHPLSTTAASVDQSTTQQHNQQTVENHLPVKQRPPRHSVGQQQSADHLPRQNGQCPKCLRIMSLTLSGLLHKHGPAPGCPGTGQLPVDGSIASSQHSKSALQPSTSSNSVGDTTNCSEVLQTSTNIMDLLNMNRRRVLKRVPRSSRVPAANKLADLLHEVTSDPDAVDKWVNLLLFTYSCLCVPGQRGGKRHLSSLASKVNKAIASFPAVSLPLSTTQHKTTKQRRPLDNLAARVSGKLEDGDIRGAIRLAASSDTVAPFDQATADALRVKHPSRSPSVSLQPPPNNDICLSLQEFDIIGAIKSFVPGSAGGLDGLRPQHLKDLTCASTGDAGHRLLARLTDFSNMCLSGRVPAAVQPVFCGASLCALNKKDGGIRPIAVGNTFRRLVAKSACKAVMGKLTARFMPVQLGFGVPRATEAAVHAAREFVSGLQPGQGVLKLDFFNAFNTIRRDSMFESIRELVPELYPFVHLCYSQASHLSFGEFLLTSDEGAQQGDPLGPLLFCASSLKLAKCMTAELNVWYLDDGTIGGDVDTLIKDLCTVREVGRSIGLLLNENKCEIVTDDKTVASSLQAVLPNVRHVPCREAMLLGAPIGDKSSIDNALSDRLSVFKRLADRLQTLNAHDALFLLKNCFSTPKILYTLRCAPCYDSTVLQDYDNVIKYTLNVILNIEMTEAVWNQATLPVSSGGLGVRLATDLALPAFLSSVAGSSGLVQQLLPKRFVGSIGLHDISFTASCHMWQSKCNSSVPDASSIGLQKVWDSPLVKVKLESVLSAAQTQAGLARLLAAGAPHAGDFLNAVPCSAVGTRLDDTSLRIAVALRLGATMCAPHTCVCGQHVDSSGIHGLACRKSAGRHLRHNTANDLIKRALTSANVPTLLEPSSLSRDDGKRPDGLTVLPWANGRCLVWDFTCPDTLASSHLNRAVLGPGTVANDAESRKAAKYSSLATLYNFTPIAVETFGALGNEALAFFRDVGRRVAAVTEEPRSFQFLMQRLSVSIQRGNAACIVGTVPQSASWDELFYL